LKWYAESAFESALKEWARPPTFYLLKRHPGGKTVKGGDLYERVVEATLDLARGLSLEVVDVETARERGRVIVRIAVDRKGGVTLDDCAGASELIGQVLDRENVIEGPYVLEVMSPGLDRPLKRPADFIKSGGGATGAS
jgi:ribosome maturation factor RimP